MGGGGWGVGGGDLGSVRLLRHHRFFLTSGLWGAAETVAGDRLPLVLRSAPALRAALDRGRGFGGKSHRNPLGERIRVVKSSRMEEHLARPCKNRDY